MQLTSRRFLFVELLECLSCRTTSSKRATEFISSKRESLGRSHSSGDFRLLAKTTYWQGCIFNRACVLCKAEPVSGKVGLSAVGPVPLPTFNSSGPSESGQTLTSHRGERPRSFTGSCGKRAWALCGFLGTLSGLLGWKAKTKRN